MGGLYNTDQWYGYLQLNLLFAVILMLCSPRRAMSYTNFMILQNKKSMVENFVKNNMCLFLVKSAFYKLNNILQTAEVNSSLITDISHIYTTGPE